MTDSCEWIEVLGEVVLDRRLEGILRQSIPNRVIPRPVCCNVQ